MPLSDGSTPLPILRADAVAWLSRRVVGWLHREARMSKDKPQQKPEPKDKLATLCVGLSQKDGKYLIEEVHLGADGKVLERKPLRTVRGRKEAFGYSCIDMEHCAVRWQQEGLLP